MLERPRRLRQNNNIRDLVSEISISANDFIYPIFIKENCVKEEIRSLPEQFYFGKEALQKEIEELIKLGIKAIALFPVVDESKKTSLAENSYKDSNFLNQTVSLTKKNFADSMLIATDVALDPYTNHGHDGIIENGEILNDKTVDILCKMAISQVNAGADIICPSDMMDARVINIRQELEKNAFENKIIMSYTAKYASSLYGPFRRALASLGTKKSTKGKIPLDKKTYQMDFKNKKEALKEFLLDDNESADILMVKPASWYLDIIQDFKNNSLKPIAAYQVSGEYAMLMNAINNNILEEKEAIIESIFAIKRAGADIILSYFAKKYLKELNFFT